MSKPVPDKAKPVDPRFVQTTPLVRVDTTKTIREAQTATEVQKGQI